MEGCVCFTDYFMRVQQEIILNENSSSFFTSETLLIPVPSSGGFNQLPNLFAERIAASKHCRIIEINAVKTSKRNSIETMGEAKNAFLLRDRNLRFAPYILNETSLAKCRKHKNIILIDDIINTGETVVNLSKQLEAAGLKVSAAFGMMPIANTYPKFCDLRAVTDEVSAVLSLDKEQSERFCKRIEKVFGEYTERRLSRKIKKGSFSTFDKAIRFKEDVEKAYGNILTLETKINLDKGFNKNL